MKKQIVLFLFFGLAVSLQAKEDWKKVDSTYQINEVVVTANKTEVARNNVPLSISVVSRKQIEESSESALLPVLSQRVPGLFVSQRGVTGFGVSEGAAGVINIRGVGSGNKVLVLFDGQPQWAGVFGHSLPDTYVASDVEKVEVIRGPGSILYGSNAMGGVVNIITRHQMQEGVTTHLRAMYGSYNTQKYMVNNGVKAGKFNSFISLNHDRTDGHRTNSEFNITNGFAKVGYDINDHFKTSGDVSVAQYNPHNPGTEMKPMLENWMKIWRGTASYSLENFYKKSNGGLRFFYNWGNHKINDGHTADKPAKEFLFRSKDHNTGVLLYQSLRLFRGNEFTVGLDYKNWGGTAWNDYFNGNRDDIVDKNVHETAGYAIMQQSFWEKLTLNAGVRYEYSSVFGGEWVPQAGIIYRPVESNVIKASVSKGFRSPTIRELYISYLPYSAANQDLKPENMMNYEISVGQSFWDHRIYAELTAFYIDGKDMIQPVKGQLQNIGRFYNKGIEFDASVRALKNLQFSTNYSFLHTNKDIAAAPKHKFFAEAMYTLGIFSLNVNVQSIFDLNLIGNEVAKEDYTLLNARLSCKLPLGSQKRNITLFLKGENLTNTSYSVNYGYPMPGAVVFGGFDLKF